MIKIYNHIICIYILLFFQYPVVAGWEDLVPDFGIQSHIFSLSSSNKQTAACVLGGAALLGAGCYGLYLYKAKKQSNRVAEYYISTPVTQEVSTQRIKDINKYYAEKIKQTNNSDEKTRLNKACRQEVAWEKENWAYRVLIQATKPATVKQRCDVYKNIGAVKEVKRLIYAEETVMVTYVETLSINMPIFIDQSEILQAACKGINISTKQPLTADQKDTLKPSLNAHKKHLELHKNQKILKYKKQYDDIYTKLESIDLLRQ